MRKDAFSAGYRLAFAANGDAGDGLLELPRRTIGPTDRACAFRLKTAASAIWLYRAKGWLRRFKDPVVYPADVALR